MKNTDIIFVINPILWTNNSYPTGVLCLSAYLTKMGFENTIIDSAVSRGSMNSSEREEAIINKVIELEPKVVCFSATHREFAEVVRMNNAIRRLGRDIITIVGGAQPTYRSEDFLDNGFNFVGIGEGEVTLFEFVKEVFNHSYRWAEVKGLVWKDGEKIIRNPPRDLMTSDELNDLPILPYHKIDKKYFDLDLRIIRGLALKGTLMMTTRGCPFSCSYCGCNLIFGRKLRFFSLAHIEREVRHLKENYGIEAVWLVDDIFTVKRDHVIGVANIFKKYGLIWGCQSRVDSINEDLIKIMKDAGCVQVDFGIESGSQRILDDVMGKQITIEQVMNAMRLAKKYGLRTLANFMIGLPTETYEDLRMTEKLADRIKADVNIFTIATPLPGTRLYNMVNEKISPHEYPLLDWNGSVLMEKINKSELRNLTKERLRLERKYFLRTVVRSIFSGYNLLFFLKSRYKFQRIVCVLRYLVRYLIDKIVFLWKRYKV